MTGTATAAERRLEAVRGDVIEQRLLDRHREGKGPPASSRSGNGRPPAHGLLTTRIRSTLEALAQPDELFAQRQALVDLASTCQELAAAYDRPQR